MSSHDGVKRSIAGKRADRDELGYADTIDTRDRLVDDLFRPGINPESRATKPWFKQEINPWSALRFAPQSAHVEWLNHKRDACKKDLHALKQLLGKVATAPFEKRKEAFESVLRQASGAPPERRHIDRTTSRAQSISSAGPARSSARRAHSTRQAQENRLLTWERYIVLLDRIKERLAAHGHQLGVLDDLDESAAALVLNRKHKTLRQWRSLGGGPDYTKSGSRVRFPIEALLRYLDTRFVEH